MATNISAHLTPARITLGAAGLVTKINCLGSTARVTFRAIATDCQLTYTGTDGAAIGASYQTLPADVTLQEDYTPHSNPTLATVGGLVLYIASVPGGGIVEVTTAGRGS